MMYLRHHVNAWVEGSISITYLRQKGGLGQGGIQDVVDINGKQLEESLLASGGHSV